MVIEKLELNVKTLYSHDGYDTYYFDNPDEAVKFFKEKLFNFQYVKFTYGNEEEQYEDFKHVKVSSFVYTDFEDILKDHDFEDTLKAMITEMEKYNRIEICIS